MRLIGQLEARVSLCEAAIVTLLGAMTGTDPVRAELSRRVMLKAGNDIFSSMANGLGAEADARVTHTINSFLAVLQPPGSKT